MSNQKTTQSQLDTMGEQIANGIAIALMRGVGAGVAKFLTAMESTELAASQDLLESGRKAQTTRLLKEAERIECEKTETEAAIKKTRSPLKRLALQVQLAQLQSEEDRLCDQVEAMLPPDVQTEEESTVRRLHAQ